jgi:hypothetical protein
MLIYYFLACIQTQLPETFIQGNGQIYVAGKPIEEENNNDNSQSEDTSSEDTGTEENEDTSEDDTAS